MRLCGKKTGTSPPPPHPLAAGKRRRRGHHFNQAGDASRFLTEPPMFTRDRIRNGLYVLGIIAIFPALMPDFHYQGGTTPDDGQRKHLIATPQEMPYSEEY